jgi:hypothetical protein
LFDPADIPNIPIPLKRYHSFDVSRQQGYDDLLGWLRESGSPQIHDQVRPQKVKWTSIVTGFQSRIANRAAEKDLFSEMITGRSQQRILMLSGASGTGKSVLLAEFHAYAKHLGLAVASFDFKGCPSEHDLFESLRLDLGSQILKESFFASGANRFYEVIADLQRVAQPVVLFFDTYQEASTSSQTWIEAQLLPRLDRAPGVVVVISGQRVPDHDKSAWRSLVAFRELLPITSAEAWLEYARHKWEDVDVPLNPDYVGALTLATRGHPGQMDALLETLMAKVIDNHPE